MDAALIRLPKATRAAGFDFCSHMRRLCQSMVDHLPELGHIDLSRVAVAYSQTRKPVSYGLQATLTPMRFEGGSVDTRRGGRRITVQRVFDHQNREVLYILTFYLPRYLNLCLEEKVSTALHELWHIGPQFDGDVRRFPGRCYAHGPSEQQYDAAVERLARRWWAARPDAASYAFLRDDFRTLTRRYGAVYGLRIPAPKLIPVAD